MKSACSLFLLLTLLSMVSASYASEELPANTIAQPPEDATGTEDAAEEGGATQAEVRLLVPNEHEEILSRMIIEHPEQQRGEMVYDPHLHLVARAKVLDMARRKYKGHFDPDGFGPNHVVRSLGYEFPPRYSKSKNANNIESFVWSGIKARGDNVEVTEDSTEVSADFVKWWYNSAKHKKHLLGQGFNADQTRFGIGYAQSHIDPSRGGGRRQTRFNYAVFITAPPSLTEPVPLSREIVDDYLSRTPAEREKEARARRSP